MATAVFDPILKTSSGNPNRRNVAPRKTPPPHPVLGKIALLAVLAGLVTVVTLAISVETSKEMALPGGVTTFIGSMTGIVGMYLALVMVLVVARIPALERILGQDGMLRWHRRLSPWPISLLIAHAIFVTIGYAQAAKTGSLHELGNLINSYPDVLAATVGLGLMVLIGIASIRAIRTRLKRETWWVLHLYIYLALALSFAHVLALGPSFVGHPLVRLFWSVIWAATAGTVIVYRFGIPIFRSFKFGLTVQEVIREGPDVVSV
ncbi:MAG TPA: ferric reductase-like transmembrane domain-containing protein, partial [Acidimicrobiales bacterium]|nr:ferric reductase-like transmembrane domain-containing protein [Acidimicrobiales bacterium]